MEKIVYLTFDDGPDEYTEEILDLLKNHQVKATFFNLGIQEKKYPDSVKRLIKEGHSLGNHTYSHNPNLYKDISRFIQEVKKPINYRKIFPGKYYQNFSDFLLVQIKLLKDLKK